MFLCLLPEFNVFLVAVVRATRIQASRLPSGATSKSTSFLNQLSSASANILCVFDYHDIDWTVFVVIVLYHFIEVINSQTISEPNGVMTANT